MKASTASLIKPFYPALDGLRAVAILMVFMAHSATFFGSSRILGWGWMGVDLFFVLSGFLITGILYDTLQKPHYFTNFYLRRSLRIFPLFYGFWLLMLFLTPVLHVGWNGYLFATAAYIGNFFGPHGQLFAHPSPFEIPAITPLRHEARQIGVGHLWTLCVEEQFYLVWPALIWFVRSRRSLLRLCLVAVIAAPFFRWFIYLHLPFALNGTNFLYTNTFTRVDTLLLGSAIALWLRGPQPTLHFIRKTYTSLCVIPPTVLVLCLLSKSNHWQVGYNESFIHPIVATFGFTLIGLTSAGVLLAAIDTSSVVSRVLNSRPLGVIGRLSYGIYFFHVFLLQIFTGQLMMRVLHYQAYLGPLLAAPVTGVVAWLSFRYFESPFLRLKDRFTAHHGAVTDPPAHIPSRSRTPALDLAQPAA